MQLCAQTDYYYLLFIYYLLFLFIIYYKAQKNLGINKHLSMFLPRKTLDQMYKVLVRSHLDYCDMIYHIPSVHTQFGVTLTDLIFFLYGFSFLENKVTKPWFDREIKPSPTAIPEIYNINTLI